MHMKTLSLAAALSLLPALAASADVWGIKSNASSGGLSNAPAWLYRFAENGSSFVDIGAIHVGGAQVDADALAMASPSDIYAFEIGIAGSRLLRLDPLTAAATPVGDYHVGRDIRGAVMIGQAQVLAVDVAANQLLRVDAASGTIVAAPVNVDLDLEDGVDIAFRPQTGQYYLSRYETGAAFYTVDIATGATALQFLDTAGDVWTTVPFTPGIAFSLDAPGNRLFAYEANGSDDIYFYSLGGANPRTLLWGSILGAFNSGRGDLATAIPEPGTLGLAAVAALALRRRRVGSAERLRR